MLSSAADPQCGASSGDLPQTTSIGLSPNRFELPPRNPA
jgi:hypothetical protein